MKNLPKILFFTLLFSQETEVDSIFTSNQDQSKINFFTSSYKLERWFYSEGNSEGLSDTWLDRYFEPRDINFMNYDDIISLPNITPLDANAVLTQKKRGRIDGTFELKNSPGISYYGYKNLIDFVDFNKKAESQFHLRISSLIRTTPITTNPDSDGESVEYYYSDQPEQFHRISSSYLFGQNQAVLKTGMIYKQNMGETKNIFTDKKFIELGYLPIYDTGIQLDRIIIGNFNSSFIRFVIFIFSFSNRLFYII